MGFNSVQRRLSILALLSLFAIGLMSIQGCEPLRKKFRREKKKKVKEEVPLLEPVDYPDHIERSVEDLYSHHYGLWRVWHRELTVNIMDDFSRKRQIYMVKKELANLLGMQVLLKEAKRKELGVLIEKIERIRKDLLSPIASQNASSMKRRLESTDKKIRQGFNPRVVADDLIRESISP